MSVAPGRRSAGIMVIILGQITTSKGRRGDPPHRQLAVWDGGGRQGASIKATSYLLYTSSILASERGMQGSLRRG